MLKIINARLAIDTCLEQEEVERLENDYATRVNASAKQLEKTMVCFCDLDRWEPEPITGHSWVCPIHKAAIRSSNYSG